MEHTKSKREENNVPGNMLTTDRKRSARPGGRNINCSAIEDLISEGGSNFVRYLDMQDLLSDTDILLLSPKRHYFVDHKELLSTRTLIYMKKLNLTDNLESFLSDLRNLLSPGTNLVGCFSDSNRISKSQIVSALYKKVVNYLDSRTDNRFTNESVGKLLESCRFQVKDMTLIRGSVYFRALAV